MPLFKVCRMPLMLAALFAVVLASPLLAEDWTEFRGPGGDGHSATTDLPLTWSKSDHVIWRVDLPGKGWSSPISLGEDLFVTTAVPVEKSTEGDDSANEPQSLRLLCLDIRTGGTLWDREIFVQDGKRAGKIHGKNSHASPTPLTDGKRIFVHFGTHGTACLDLQGKILWKNTEQVYAPVHGNGGSPVLVQNRLIFSCDGGDQQYVVGLDADTGKVAWTTPRKFEYGKKFAFSTPLVLTRDGQTQVISPGAGGVASYDPQTGAELWRVRYDGYSVIPKPVFGNGLIYLSTGYDRPKLLAIKPDGKGDVTETHVAWTADKGVSHSASFLLVEDELYMISDNGVATCLNAVTGEQYWQQRVGGNYSASPIFAENRIYLLSEQGEGIVLARGKSFEELARNPLETRTLASYAVADGALFIRTEEGLYRIQER